MMRIGLAIFYKRQIPNPKSQKISKLQISNVVAAFAAASASTTRCVLVIVIWSFFGVLKWGFGTSTLTRGYWW
jgi:hypothetical protein